MHEVGPSLPRYARAVIHEALGGERTHRPNGGKWDLPTATFVSLHHGDDLQGCIGSLEPRRTLIEDVHYNALAAAFEDPRGRRLSLAHVDLLEVEVSVLSPLAPIEFADEASAARALRPHVDGVVLRAGRHRGTFLPQVWEQLPDPHHFLLELKRKAGLPYGFWSDDVRLERYTVEKWVDAPRAFRAPGGTS